MLDIQRVCPRNERSSDCLVLAANGGVASLTFFRLEHRILRGRSSAALIVLLFEVILPVLRIVLELVNWKFEDGLNVGCFAGAGCFWLVGGCLGPIQSHFRCSDLIIALGMLIVAGLTRLSTEQRE